MPICPQCRKGYDESGPCPNCGAAASPVSLSPLAGRMTITEFTLIVGLIVSVVGCASAVVTACVWIVQLVSGDLSFLEFLLAEFATAVAFCYSWAMCAVFSRVSRFGRQ